MSGLVAGGSRDEVGSELGCMLGIRIWGGTLDGASIGTAGDRTSV